MRGFSDARNGIYGAAARFLIEDCRFENIGETGLRVADFVPADSSHILIRRTHLLKTNLNCTPQEAISIDVLMDDRAHTWKNGMSDVFILQNRITDHNKVGCALWATQNARICENRWENSEIPDFGFHCWGRSPTKPSSSEIAKTCAPKPRGSGTAERAPLNSK